jgi:beta-galactosidase
VEAVRRSGPDCAWLFLLNHTESEQHVPAEGVNVLTGAPMTGRASIPPGGVTVVRTDP